MTILVVSIASISNTYVLAVIHTTDTDNSFIFGESDILNLIPIVWMLDIYHEWQAHEFPQLDPRGMKLCINDSICVTAVCY